MEKGCAVDHNIGRPACGLLANKLSDVLEFLIKFRKIRMDGDYLLGNATETGIGKSLVIVRRTTRTISITMESLLLCPKTTMLNPIQLLWGPNRIDL